MIEGIGLNWICDNTKDAMIDDAEKVADHEALNIAKYIIRHEGLLIGSTTAINLAAAVKHCLRNKLKGKRVVTISCDDGFRHISKFYNREKWEANHYEFKVADVTNMLDLSFISF